MAGNALDFYKQLIKSPNFKYNYDYSAGTFDSDFGLDEDEKLYPVAESLVPIPEANEVDTIRTLKALITHNAVHPVIKARAAVAIGLHYEFVDRAGNGNVDNAAEWYRYALTLEKRFQLQITRTSLNRLYHNKCGDTGVVMYNYCMAKAYNASSIAAKADACIDFIKQFSFEKFINFLVNDKIYDDITKQDILLDLLIDPRQFCTPEQFKASLTDTNNGLGWWLVILEANLLTQIQQNAKTASKTVTAEAKGCRTDYFRNKKLAKANALDAFSTALNPQAKAVAHNVDDKLDAKHAGNNVNVAQQIINAVNNTTLNHTHALDGGGWKSSRFWSTPTGNRTGDVFAGALLALKRLGLSANEPQQQLADPTLRTIMTAKPG